MKNLLKKVIRHFAMKWSSSAHVENSSIILERQTRDCSLAISALLLICRGFELVVSPFPPIVQRRL